MNFFRRLFGSRSGAQEPEEKEEKPISIQDVVDNLRLLAEAETLVASFYDVCSEVTEEKEFWQSMARSELRHAENIRRMSALIKQEPARYRPGSRFSSAAIRTFSLHLSNLLERLRNGEIRKEELLSLADDIERSAVELNYSKIVVTDVREFKALAGEIDSESAEHKSAIMSRLKKPGSAAP